MSAAANASSGDKIHAGFISLIDSAPVIAAKEAGFAAEEGLDLELRRETSWATLRDRLAVGHLDVAHMLGAMPIAGNLGLTALATPLIVPMTLGSGGNAITIAAEQWPRLAALGAPDRFEARRMVGALAALVEERRASGLPRLVFGVVHAYSSHHYQLAYWLSAGGIRPGEDIEIVAVPPSLMAAALASGRIDGFCCGEPWGSVAVADGAGRMLLTNAHVWCNGPDKVLGVRKSWQEADPGRCERLIRAIYKAALWCDEPSNREALADLLSRADYVGAQRGPILAGLSKRLRGPAGEVEEVEGFLNYAADGQSFPWLSHAYWFYSQMVRLGQARLDANALIKVAATYRPDIYRSALVPLGVPMPAADVRREGAIANTLVTQTDAGRLVLGRDTFFDGRIFDPDDIAGYLGPGGGADVPPVGAPEN